MTNRELFAPDGYRHPHEVMIEADQEEEIIGYRPHAKQLLLHRSDARFRVMTCGRRFGKTTACAFEIIRFALENPGSLCWWVAPYARTSRIAYRQISKAVKPFTVRNSRTEMRIELDNGSAIEFRSAENPDSLRGEGIHFLVMDEAAMVRREAWEEVLRPMLSDHRGKAIFISTPKGRNWFYELFMRGKHPDFPEYESFRFPTSSNPYIPEDDIEEARKTLPPDVFRQEYMAEFLEDSAGVFRGVSKCIQGELEPPRDDADFVMGVDLARASDYTVITVMDVRRRHVVAWDRFNQVDWKLQLDRIERLAREYNAKVWIDSTGVGDAIYEALWDRGLDVEGFKFTSTSKKQLIHNLQLMIAEQDITFPDIPELVHELTIFQYELTPSGHLKYAAPAGGFDDAVMSLALAAWGVKEHTPPQLFL